VLEHVAPLRIALVIEHRLERGQVRRIQRLSAVVAITMDVSALSLE